MKLTSVGVVGVTLVFSVAAFVLETVLYLAKVGWYYRLGPAMRRERWQSRVAPTAATDAIRRALPASDLSYAQRGSSFCLRQTTWWSTWPRMHLAIEDVPGGAIVVYEVRPFVTGILFIVVFGLMLLIGYVSVVPLAGAGAIIATYAVYVPWEIARLRRLAPLRRHLRDIGLSICTNCGYDLHLRSAGQPCPECGLVAES